MRADAHVVVALFESEHSAQGAVAALATLLSEEKGWICRHWAKELRSEIEELEVAGRDLRAPLDPLVEGLARLLVERGEEGLRLWPDTLRAHAALRYDQHFDPEDLAREFKALHQVLLQAYVRRHHRLDPELAVLLASLLGEAQGAVQAAYTRLLRTEEVQAREAALMESVLHNVDVGILLRELDGSVSYATPMAGRLFGVPGRALMGAQASDVFGKLLGRVDARHLDGSPFRVKDMPCLRVLKEKTEVRGVWMTLRRPPRGEEAFLELNATPVWDPARPGELVGVISTLSDRTETALQSRSLRRAYEELHRLQLRLVQKARGQAVGFLAGGAAHALNNLLNVLRLRLTLLRRDPGPGQIAELDRTVERIGHLVSSFQQLATPAAPEELQTVDVAPLVQETAELLRPELAGATPPIALGVQVGGPGRVRADAGLLRELVFDLVLFARDRMKEGGPIDLSAEVHDRTVVVRIADLGPSFTEEELLVLADPLKGPTSAPGRALVVASGRAQVQSWGGEFVVSNREAGAGVLYTLKLPLLAEEQPQERLSTASRIIPEGRVHQARSVLVVDDDPDNAIMMADVLTEEGYEAQVATGAKEALELWKRHGFDAALVDALMPDVSGWELVRELRRLSPQVLLAIVTGADVRGQSRESLATVDAVFQKPVDLSALDDFLSRPEAASAPESPPLPEAPKAPVVH